MPKLIDWQETHRQASPILDKLELILTKHPPHLGMIALAIQLASFKIGDQYIAEDVICELIHDVARIRNTADK